MLQFGLHALRLPHVTAAHDVGAAWRGVLAELPLVCWTYGTACGRRFTRGLGLLQRAL